MPQNRRGADLLARSLCLSGVERIFTLSGNHIMPVFDACVDGPLELIHVRHEAAAVHMADAWGRLTGDPGIALVTAGPGFANTLSALFVAMAAESPLVLISGHAPQHQVGRGGFQEMTQAEMAGHVVKASWTCTSEGQIGHDIARAIRTARSGRPGPVHVSIPFDLLEATVDQFPAALPRGDDCLTLFNMLDAATAEATLAQIAAAESPLIVAGPSTARTAHRSLLRSLEDSLGIPVVAMENPRGLNDPALGRFAEVAAVADLVVLIGQPLNFMLKFGAEPAFRSDCRFIVIDPEMRVIEQIGVTLNDGQRLPITGLADAVPTIERLAQLSSNGDDRDSHWVHQVRNATAFRPQEWASTISPMDGPLHPIALCRAVQRTLAEADETVMISDGGEFGQWAQACVTADHRLINGPSGSIGSNLAFAAAARCAFPDARIVSFLGDGTVGFHVSEFDTAVRYNLPFVAIVGNDACWNAERQIQLRDYGEERLIGCDLLPTRYDEVAIAFGAHGEFVQTPDELEPALDRAFASGLPACVNVAIEGAAAPLIAKQPG